ncbi:MAG TPA: hypothetical protein ENH43_01500 [Phycisphaerales bacterium]|nr:hypothetical protein [Phycisphaerales bacterium]
MRRKINRRELLGAAAAGIAGLAAAGATRTNAMATKKKLEPGKKLFLLRYDTEWNNARQMAGFLEKVVAVHRQEQIPATFFCKGAALDAREREFRAFYKEVKDDPLFDIQDHSYSHIGLGYERGSDIETLRADYEKSFATHERIFGVRPIGISRCGTSGKDGPRLSGFDATEKSRAELDMVASLGVKMINSFLTGIDGRKVFINYGKIGHPDIMGFVSGYSDTIWMLKLKYGEAMEYVFEKIKSGAARNEHMPLMLHDWVAWTRAPDKELTHVKTIVDLARKLGYELVTHIACLKNKALWA